MKKDTDYEEEDEYSKIMGPEPDLDDEQDEWDEDEWELDEDLDDEDE
jgi:hypothetical protein